MSLSEAGSWEKDSSHNVVVLGAQAFAFRDLAKLHSIWRKDVSTTRIYTHVLNRGGRRGIGRDRAGRQ